MNRPLARVLAAKIALTVSLWAAPLLCFPVGWLQALGFEVPEPVLFLRLLGAAYVALTVAYGFGLREVLQGGHPAAAVWVGLVSNGGACALLAWHAMAGAWAGWGVLAQGVMWLSLVGTGGVTLGLMRFGVAGVSTKKGFAAPRRV